MIALSAPQTAYAATCTFDDGGAELQAAFDGITTDPLGSSNIDVTTDCLGDLFDSNWSIGGSGGSIGVVVSDDPFGTSFGIYDAADSSKRVEVFASGDPSGALALISILSNGMVLINATYEGIDFASNRFGYYIEHLGQIFYSDSSLNPAGIDYMYAYAGNGDEIQIDPYSAGEFGFEEFMLAWSNHLVGGEPMNFSGLVVLVGSVSPVPEPATLGLLASVLPASASPVGGAEHSNQPTSPTNRADATQWSLRLCLLLAGFV